MSSPSTLEADDPQLVNRAVQQIGVSCGLSSDDIHCIFVNSDNAELQFIELIEHLTVLVGSSPVAQSGWLKTTNLDLGQALLSLTKAQGGVEHVRDYLAGQRHRC